MRVSITMELDVSGIDAEGDFDSEHSLHSLARSYYLHEYGDASELGDCGLGAFESAVLATVVQDGIGEVAESLGNPIAVLGSFVCRLEEET